MRLHLAFLAALLLLNAAPLAAQGAGGLALLREAAKVEVALAEDAVLRAYQLGTDAVDGRIVLRGAVRTAEERARAEALAGANAAAPVQNALALDPEAGLDPAFRTQTDAPVAAISAPKPRARPEPVREPEMDEAEIEAEPEPVAAHAPRPAPAAPTPEPAATSEVYHTVKSGDSLYKISRQYGTSVATIQKLNGIDGSRIKPGQRLRVK